MKQDAEITTECIINKNKKKCLQSPVFIISTSLIALGTSGFVSFWFCFFGFVFSIFYFFHERRST